VGRADAAVGRLILLVGGWYPLSCVEVPAVQRVTDGQSPQDPQIKRLSRRIVSAKDLRAFLAQDPLSKRLVGGAEVGTRKLDFKIHCAPNDRNRLQNAGFFFSLRMWNLGKNGKENG
jgi:hypothetical protein